MHKIAIALCFITASILSMDNPANGMRDIKSFDELEIYFNKIVAFESQGPWCERGPYEYALHSEDEKIRFGILLPDELVNGNLEMVQVYRLVTHDLIEFGCLTRKVFTYNNPYPAIKIREIDTDEGAKIKELLGKRKARFESLGTHDPLVMMQLEALEVQAAKELR